MDPIRVLVVDDHILIRTMLVERLEREKWLRVVGSAATSDDAVEQAIARVPDVVLMDIDMPGQATFEAATRIIAARPEVRIVFLSAYTYDHYIERAIRLGAAGYLTKTEPIETLLAAIRTVAAGATMYSEAVRRRLISTPEGPKLSSRTVTRGSLLTAREIEVVRHIARGLAKKEIASLMHVSVKTVDKHTCNIMDKLDIHDRVDLARFAIREGLSEA